MLISVCVKNRGKRLIVIPVESFTLIESHKQKRATFHQEKQPDEEGDQVPKVLRKRIGGITVRPLRPTKHIHA